METPQTATLDDVYRDLLRRDFPTFAREAFSHIDSAQLDWGENEEDLARHLQAVYEGRIPRLLANVMPRSLKSTLTMILFPAWVWANDPSAKFLAATHTLTLTLAHATRCRELVESDWYKSNFRDLGVCSVNVKSWRLADDQNAKSYFRTSEHGHYFSVGVGGKVTGHGGDYLLVDDANDAADVWSEDARRRVIEWHDGKLLSRVNDKRRFRAVVIAQRLHQNDLSGHLLARGGYQHYCAPLEFETARRGRTFDVEGKTFWEDPREVEGQILNPVRYPPDVVKELRVSSLDYDGQYQQRPTAKEGGVLKEAWFRRRWVLPGETAPDGMDVYTLPESFDRMAIYVDATFGDTKNSDYVAIGLFGRHGRNVYMLDCTWAQLSFIDACDAVRVMKRAWPDCHSIKIEKAANGAAMIDTLAREYSGVEGLKVVGKASRINATSPYISAGNFILPAFGSWVRLAVSESCAYPRGKHDDWIDMVSYALGDMLDTPMAMDVNAVNSVFTGGY